MLDESKEMKREIESEVEKEEECGETEQSREVEEGLKDEIESL